MKAMTQKIREFLNAEHEDAQSRLDEALRLSMTENSPQASCLWIDGEEIEMESYPNDDDAFAEMMKHDAAVFIPAAWHEHEGCDWIWTETDSDPESDTYGENLWCCAYEEGSGKFYRINDMWDEVLDYANNNWVDEVKFRIMDYTENYLHIIDKALQS